MTGRSSAKSIIMMAFFLTMPTSMTMPIMAITDRSILNNISVSSAPMPADGRPEMMVIGWMKLSYRMPSTTKAAKTAATTRMPWPFKDSWNTWALPWKPVMIDAGRFVSRSNC